MIDTLKKLLGIGPRQDWKSMVKAGAKIMDVRSREEYATGHIKGSFNIPLNELDRLPKNFKPDDVIITCCASGLRSSMALSRLKSIGFLKVYNGGGWHSLNKRMTE